MGKMKDVQNIDNQMVSQIRELLDKSFPPIFGYKVKYFVGVEEDTERAMLVFELVSKTLGNVYKKSIRMDSVYAIDDYEADFIGKILADFIMLGTSFLTQSIVNQKEAKKEDVDALQKSPFSKGRLSSLNLN